MRNTVRIKEAPEVTRPKVLFFCFFRENRGLCIGGFVWDRGALGGINVRVFFKNHENDLVENACVI